MVQFLPIRQGLCPMGWIVRLADESFIRTGI
jgi:hypothetical protein